MGWNMQGIRIGVILFASVISSGSIAADYRPDAKSLECLECHREDERITFANGTSRSIRVDTRVFGDSVHIDLGCDDCHMGYSDEHPADTHSSYTALRQRPNRACLECHDEAKESVHGDALDILPQMLCTSCHGGGHTVKRLDEATNCMGCHQYPIAITFPDGSIEPVAVHPELLELSVHSDLSCDDCHAGFNRSAHPIGDHPNRRAMSLELSKVCHECHDDKQERFVESIHYTMLESGRTEAPVCTDCHGAHDIIRGGSEKQRSVKRCEKCHAETYQTYAQSVHGAQVLKQNNGDVPICSDCHEAHAISDPRTSEFHYDTPTMCGECHGNADLMESYGLTANVLNSYLTNFHGITADFYRQSGEYGNRIAVCTDCHGIHDIASTKGDDAYIVKEKLLVRCRVCHEEAPEDFPTAWISHYPPTWQSAPLVYAVQLGYQILIPFMIAGLLLHILLQLFRHLLKR